MSESISVTVNGKPVSLTYNDYAALGTDRATGTPYGDFLLYRLREQLNLNAPRFGCGINECGCCTVLVDGAAVRACVMPVNAIPDGAEIQTLDGIGDESKPHPMQQAFIDEQAGQCAFCSNTMIMGAIAFINQRQAAGNKAVPTKAEIADFLSTGGVPEGEVPLQYICRCGAHARILTAIQAGAEKML